MSTRKRSTLKKRRSVLPATALLSGLVAPLLGGTLAAAESGGTDLTQLSLAELLEVPVTVVSRTSSPLNQVAGAVHVITQDDIRRSGSQSLAETLRLAPGMEVAQVNSANWAVASGGFNDTYANKLLVLRDGRSLYTPLFSGTYWNQQMTLLPDVEKIEVVLGPGASVWGANAVNGVVNVVSKSAFDTIGTLVQAGGGTELLGRASVRSGSLINENLALRVYAQQDVRDDSATPSGGRSHDASESTLAGFRLDWRNPDEAEFMLNGELSRSAAEASAVLPLFTPPYSETVRATDRSFSGFILGRWQRHLSESSTLSLDAYYDGTRIDHPVLSEKRDTGEVGLQYITEIGAVQRLSAGANYRITSDDYPTTGPTVLNPQTDVRQLPSAFVQDEITLVADQLVLTLGTKIEGVEGNQAELQPSLRLAWMPTKVVTVWGSVARAARTPSRAEQNASAIFGVYPPGTVNPTFPAVAIATGNPNLESEHLVAIETGVRWQASETLSFDVAGHSHVYDNLRTISPGTPYFDPVNSVIVLPQGPANLMHGVVWSGEAGVQWSPTPHSRLRASYSLFQPHLERDQDFVGSRDVAIAVDRSPRHQAMLWGSLDLLGSLEFDTRLRYVSALTYSAIPAYWELDARLGWKLGHGLEFALIGKGLLHSTHAEFGDSQYGGSPVSVIERSVFAQVTWRF
jgi:iron complex outermembrane recepter protein